MLRGELYDLISIETEGAVTDAMLCLRPDSIIYKAHFEGMPITPGMCLLNIASELAGRGELKGAKDIRFLAPVEPDKVTKLHYRLEETAPGKISVSVSSADGSMLYSKMSLVYE